MRLMGLAAVPAKPKLSRPAPGHEIYPYLLRGVVIDRPNQVWSADATCIRLLHGFIYVALGAAAYVAGSGLWVFDLDVR